MFSGVWSFLLGIVAGVVLTLAGLRWLWSDEREAFHDCTNADGTTPPDQLLAPDQSRDSTF